MSINWVLEVEADPLQPGSALVRLGVKDERTGTVVPLVSPGCSLETFQRELAAVKEALSGLEEEARGKIEALAGTGKAFDPDLAWKEMEACGTDDEMVLYFNALSQSQRVGLAEYVFSRVNMFKGRGPVFSERYDNESHRMD